MDKEEIKKDIRKFSAIEAVSLSVGGKILVKSLEQDVTSCIDKLSNKYDILSHTELIATCASLSTRLALLRALKKAKKLKEIATEELKFLSSEE